MRAYIRSYVFSDTSSTHTHFYLLVLFLTPFFHMFNEIAIWLSNWDLLADVEAEKQEISNQRENNNSVYAAEKSPDKRTNGGVEVNNAGVVNSPDLSPIKNARNGETEETEVRKTKVNVPFEVDHYCHINLFRRFLLILVQMHFIKIYDFSVQRWPTDKAYYIAKELLMTERTYKKDLDVINVVSEVKPLRLLK